MLDGSDKSDLRRARRQGYVHFAWFHCLDDCAGGVSHGVARSCDVAEGGIGLVTTHPLKPACRVFVVLVAPVGRVAAIGTVMHCRSDGAGQFRVGVTVDLVPPTDQPTWARMARSAG